MTLALAACGTDDDAAGPGVVRGDSPATASTTASSNSTDGLTEEEVQAMIDKSIAAYDLKIKKWMEDEFVSDDELEALVDEELAELLDTAGFLTQDDIDNIVAELKEAGMSEEQAEEVGATLVPTDGPQQGIAGANPCKNREGGALVEMMLRDLGRELKLADTARPEGEYLKHRVSFVDYDENDLKWQETLVALWNERVGNEKWEFTLLETARARVYWCAGYEADGSMRSGVWRHQVTIPAGKVLYDFGNGVWTQKDCDNLTVFLWPPDEPPPSIPGTTTTTTTPPTTAPPATTTPTTIPGTTTTTTTTPTTTAPTTTVVVTTTTEVPNAQCVSVNASMNNSKYVTGTFVATNATEWRIRAGGNTVAEGAGTSFAFAGNYDVTYQLQVRGSSGVWSSNGCAFMFDKPPVNTTPAPVTTTAPASTVPPATSPATLPEDPPEVTNPEPISTVTPTSPAPPVSVPCDPRLPRGVPGACD
jgi:hypothetical protein